jgi:hypothetical protein
MPAQWPIFINNVSSKLASRSSKGPDDFGTFMANEYFNAVKTAQTPFGNLHKSGQKSILEAGFKKAFNDLFKSASPTLEDKITDPNYSDLLEGLPVPKKYNAEAEFKKWLLSKGDAIPNNRFYEFFPPPPEPEKPELTSASLFGTPDEQNQTILIFTGQNGIAPYRFTYTINNGEPLEIISDEFGIANLYVPFDIPGKFKYTLIGVDDAGFPDVKHSLNQSVDVVVPNDNTKPAEVINGTQKTKLNLTEDQKFELLVKRVLYQNTEDIKFVRFLTRLSLGYESSYGKKVAEKCLALLKAVDITTVTGEVTLKYKNLYDKRLRTPKPGYGPNTVNPQYQIIIDGITYSDGIKLDAYLKAVNDKIKKESNEAYIKRNTGLKTGLVNPLNKKIIQLEHKDDIEVWPTWMTDYFICKFCYVANIDDISLEKHSNANNSNENERIDAKRKLYDEDRKKYHALKKQWIDELAITEKKDADPESEKDPYETMAKAIIAYWMSTTAAPFNSAPPVPPCNIPTPGTFIPLYYGSQKSLSANLRRAWNTGKLAQLEPLTQPITKAVASAVAVACAKHIMELKFIYVGQIAAAPSPIPMIGFVPTAF